MRELAVVAVLAVVGLIGVEYVALALAGLGVLLGSYSLFRMGQVSREMREVVTLQAAAAHQLAEKTATIDSEIRCTEVP